MKGFTAALFAIFILGVLINLAVAEYEQSLEYNQSQDQPDEPQPQVVAEHHRNKRSPYDPLIPALLLGKSAFLLGTVLGPKLFHRPYHHQRPHYHRVYHSHGGHGGHGGGYGGGYSNGWGWK